MNILWIILIIVIAVFAIGIVALFNRLVSIRNKVKNSWAQIDVQLKRRNDLIPNLVNSVKGYMKHEKETLENITKARSSIMKASTVEGKAKASNALTETLKSLFAVSENYPDLKANQNFLQLQEEITGTENKISYSRQHYNDVVMQFNNTIQKFPNNMFAGILGFNEQKPFEATNEERKNVKVEF
ncbi:MAG: LemA family protein [Candidatus Woesearchaeota archaeon]